MGLKGLTSVNYCVTCFILLLLSMSEYLKFYRYLVIPRQNVKRLIDPTKRQTFNRPRQNVKRFIDPDKTSNIQ